METKTENKGSAKRDRSRETERKDVHSIINDRILEQLEKGVIPWQRNIGELPKNFITQKPYRGVNVLLLSARDFEQPYFLPFGQLKELGGTVKDDEKPTPVVFWKKPDDNGTPGKKPSLRYLNVYNIAQCEGIPEEKFPVSVSKDKIQLCKEIIMAMPGKPEIVLDSESTFYSAKQDYIAMQPAHFFQNAGEYYSKLFELMVHSTGHEKRLARREYQEFLHELHPDAHSTEELIVQIGTFILKAHCGIAAKHADNTAHSVLDWLNKLQSDKKLIVYAGTQAQKAVDYILNVKKEDAL